MSQFQVFSAAQAQQRFTFVEKGNKGKYPWDQLNSVGDAFYVGPKDLTKNQQKIGLSITVPDRYANQGMKVEVRKATDNTDNTTGYCVVRVS